MINRLVSCAKGVIATVVLVANVIVLTVSMVPFALIKLLLPFPAVRRPVDRALNGIADAWVMINGWWIALMQKVDWRVEGLETLNPRGWYLVSSNHQSWVDILVLQKVFLRRIPMLKFFLKRELIYVPVIGFAWWALDFPFMRRGSGRSGKTDLATTRKACERFKLIPTSVINFVEGTRFSVEKKRKQNSPFDHLLKPKVGGLAIALATMGEQFEALLDVTIAYPQSVPTFWDLLSGRLSEVVVHVQQREIPRELIDGDYERDAAFRGRIQAWVQGIWQEKDARLQALLDTPRAGIAR
jgi:1-acyl-sn-glycerol-3-phosphate acyltransferase